MDINIFAKEVHQNAVAHGWWDGERTDAEIIALIHSEWSEALEEYRAGRPMVWHECEGCEREHEDVPVICEECKDCCYKTYADDGMNCPDRKKAKPEGIAVELIDGCIRILDYMGKHDAEALTEDGKPCTLDDLADLEQKQICELSTPELIANLHYHTSEAYSSIAGTAGHFIDFIYGNVAFQLLGVFGEVCTWLKANGIDAETILLEKHGYNVGRPYRHGGKRC